MWTSLSVLRVLIVPQVLAVLVLMVPTVLMVLRVPVMMVLRVPVLMVQGDRDRLVAVGNARDVARRHPAWRYVELAGVGHVPQLQVPGRLAAEVLGWLDDLPAVPLPG